MTRLAVGCFILSFGFVLGCAQAATPTAAAVEVPDSAQLATFGGGCFWCMEPPFEDVDGVFSVISGYSGGPEVNPKYRDVASGKTGHTEVVQITFDPKKVSYSQLLQIFWRSMDPTDSGGQFADRGRQYRPAIFTHSPEQKREAEASRDALAKSGVFKRPIVVEITQFSAFYQAEAYHQDYYKTNPGHYKAYRRGSGREAFLEKTWGTAGSK